MKQHEIWLHKALNDLKSAQRLSEGADPIFDTAIYHTQQCAEKSLKAYLAFSQQPIQKSHDVAFLVELCCEIDQSFDILTEHAHMLNPYSSAFRYPDVAIEPDEEDVREAIDSAKRVFEFARGKIEGTPP